MVLEQLHFHKEKQTNKQNETNNQKTTLEKIFAYLGQGKKYLELTSQYDPSKQKLINLTS